MKKLIIIPAYNESDSIADTVREIREKAAGFDYIVINDCSVDNTEEILIREKANFLSLPINLGIGGAVQTGYRYAWENGYDLAVQVDGDGQHDVSFLNQMAQVFEDESVDMVIGSRFIEKQGFQSSKARRIGISWFTFLIRILTGKVVTDPTSGLRMVGRDVIEIFQRNYPRDYPEPESTASLLKKKKKVVEIPVIMRNRQGGTSSIHLGRSVYYMIKVSLAVIAECISF